MKALNLILITSGKISEATAHIWVVSISGDNTSRVYCKSPYKAMRYAFLLKKRTGLNISDNCLCRVSHEIARSKAPSTAPEGSAPAPMQPASAAPTTTPSTRKSPPPSALHAREPVPRLEAERKDRPKGRSFP